MQDLLIPFGLERDNQSIVEPEDAPRGRACNCICPGCHAPLLSRHPKIHRIHFAHDSKHPQAIPDNDCQFSSAVAVAMMARQLAGQLAGNEIFLPSWLEKTEFQCCGERVPIPITDEHRLMITAAEAKPTYSGHVFDLKFSFDNSAVFVELYHKGRVIQAVSDDEVFFRNRSGVLAIDCDSFNSTVLRVNRDKRFSDAVLDFLLKKGTRHWLYHPRRKALLDSLFSEHCCQATHSINAQYAQKRRRCLVCNTEWLQLKTAAQPCPQGHSHLYAREVE